MESPSRPSLARNVGATLAAVALTACIWRLLLPWDLSRIDEANRPDPDALGEGAMAARIVLVLALSSIGGGLLSAVIRSRTGPPIVAAGLAWICLVTWRSFAARVTGANMAALWPILGIPAVALASCLGIAANQLTRRFPHFRPAT